MPAAATLEGHIERITFRNDQDFFIIAKFHVSGQAKPVTILGHMPEPRMGETLRLQGTWQEHARYGQQFKVEAFEVLLPAAAEEIRRYLASGFIKGIGPRTADRLIAHFGQQVLTVIEGQPQRLTQVHGIGPQTAKRIHQAWQEHHGVRALMTFLQDAGVKPAYGARIYKTYGAESLQILQTQPYRVASDLPRIGFYIADAIVRHLDLPIQETDRARACLRHLLESAHEDGHMFIPLPELLEQCSTAFELDFDAVQTALESVAAEGHIKVDRKAPGVPVYSYDLYQAETHIAQRIQAMRNIPVQTHKVDTEQMLETVVRRLAIALSQTQQNILQSTLDQRVVIITGGPGTGKTTLIRAIAAVFDSIRRDYVLAAPTGRAARRMAEVTGRPAVTLHKLLGYNPTENRFDRDRDNPLEVQAVIADEVSMMDALLMGHLMNAMPLKAVLVLVGDVSQLPSVGPGTVLADLIDARLFETFELNEVFRQAAQSPIISLAHQVRHGILPELEAVSADEPLREVTFIEETQPDRIGPIIVDLCSRHIPAQLALDGINDVQVLTPMHKGNVGTLHLNRLLQTALNPGSDGLQAASGTFRTGDKVMHLRNNYRKEVFNGEIGTVCAVDTTERRLRVAFDGREVPYDDGDLDELTLAYAISVHKSQGSEYPVIILPMVTQHYIMLQRNLLYTALTRARQMVILIGSPKAIRVAVNTDKPRQRRSLLAWRLNPDIESDVALGFQES